MGYSTKTGRYYLNSADYLYTTDIDPKNLDPANPSQLRLVNVFAPIPQWSPPNGAMAWGADLFLINTYAQHPDPNVDHIAYTSPHPWADNHLYSLYVSDTDSWNVSEPLRLTSEDSFSPPGTIRAVVAGYDQQQNVSWWFSSNYSPILVFNTVQRASIRWVNHATGAIANYTTADKNLYGNDMIFIQNRQLVFYTNGSRVYYTPRTNHPFGPGGFSESGLNYVTIPGATIMSMLYLEDRDSLLLGLAAQTIVELDLSSLTITQSSRVWADPNGLALSNSYVSQMVRDPTHSNIVWVSLLNDAQPSMGRIYLDDRDNFALYAVNAAYFPVPATPGGKEYRPGRHWVPSLDTKHFYMPGSKALRLTGTITEIPPLLSSAENDYHTIQNAVIYAYRTHDCSVHTTCDECKRDPDYCGWCSVSNTCADSEAECPDFPEPWNKTYICPISTFALPAFLPAAGGTTLNLFGSAFKEGLDCRFYIPPITTIGTPTDATFVSETSVSCQTPPAPSFGPATSLAFAVQLKDGISEWGLPYSVTYVNCTAHTTCTSCTASPGCGWCLTSDSCSHSSACSAPGDSFDSECPKINQIQPSVISAVGGTQLTIELTNVLSDPAYSYQVRFGSIATVPATFASARRAISSTLTATSPNLSGASGPLTIDVLRNPGARVVATATSALASYNCPSFTTCSSCFSAGSSCNWCPGTRTCADSSVQACSSDPGACAAITSSSPALAYTGESSALTLTGINLDSLAATGLQCIFQTTGVNLTASATAPTATSTTCQSPASGAVGPYTLSLGYDEVPVTEKIAFEIYDCTSAPCSTCIAPGKQAKCKWCNDFAGPNVGCLALADSCAAPITAFASCPATSSVAPDPVTADISTAVTLTGVFDALTNTGSNCVFQPYPSGSPTTVAVTSASTTSVGCTSNAFATPGTWTVQVEYNAVAYTAPRNFTVFSCAVLTDCASCTALTQCGWGAQGCASAGPDLIDTPAECPSLTAIVPNVALRSGGDTVTFQGGPFMPGTYNCAFTTSTGTFSSLSTSVSENYVACLTPTVTRSAAATVTLLTTGGTVPYVSGASPLSFTFVDCPTFTSSICSDTCVAFPDAVGEILEGCGFCTASGLCTTTARCGGMWVPECFKSIDVFPSFALLDGQDMITVSVDKEPQLPAGQTVLPSDFTCSFGTRTQPAIMTFPNNQSTITCQAPSSTITTVDFNVNYRNRQFTSPAPFRFMDCTQATDCGSCLAMSPCGWCLDTQQCTTPNRCPLGNYTSTICPDLRSLVPSTGSPEGGEVVSLIGDLFIPNELLVVRFGENLIQPTFLNNGTLQVLTPAHSDDKGEVAVELWFNGSKYAATSQIFTYVAGGPGSKSNVVPIAVGLSLGLLALLVLVIIIAVILYRKKKGGLIFNIREPDYAAVAFGTATELAYRMPSDDYQFLETVLGRHNFGLQVAMAGVSPPTEEDLVAKSMLYVAQAHGQSVGMINALVRGEIARCLEENTIFRNNSVASKSFKFYSRVVGIPYLWKCMARVIHELEVLGNRSDRDNAKNVDNSTSLLRMTMEVDTDRYADSTVGDVDTEVNSLQLKLTCQKLFSVLIKNGVSDIPAEFRQIFVEIDAQIMKKFNNDMAVYKAIGGFFFLRFVCPSITAPHYYGLLDRPPNETTQRQLVLISKVIQSLANMQMPGRKETYMESMSDFIEKNMGSVVKFYQDMREASRVNVGSPTHMDVPDNIRLNALASIGEFIVSYQAKLQADINANADPAVKDALNQDFQALLQQYPNKPKKMGDAASSKAPRSKKKKPKKSDA